MGYTLTPIPFWSDAMQVHKVISASHLNDFNITSLTDLTPRLAYASLYERDDNHNLVLFMANQEFIEFVPLLR